MSAHNRETERMGIALVMPLLRDMDADGSPRDTNNAREPEFWQRTIGDYVITLKGTGELLGVEVKTERAYTGNLFVETWSNCDFGRRHPGWIYTLNADALFMVYLDVRAAFWLPMRPLFNWCFDLGHLNRLMKKEKTVQASSNGEQRNVTKGVPVPFIDLLPAINGKVWQVVDGIWTRLELWELTPAGRV